MMRERDMLRLGYNGRMERLFDKVIVFACCLAIVVIAPFSVPLLIALLGSLIVSAFFEILFIPYLVRQILLGVYLVLAVFVPEAMLFLPLIVYDCYRTSSWILRLAPAVPLLAGLAILPFSIALFALVATGVACGLSWRTSQIESERSRFFVLHDDLRETSISLEEKNRDLLDKQDYEVTLATLNERGRIAREIHDNVGHLLTRSVLQVEALQVVHADDPVIKDELFQVGITLHEALDTVRKSVHDLHDDSFDLHTQLLALAQKDQRLM
ncbi:MAG: histidine kinase, partial [Raoultibacter sp.]